MNIPRQNSQIVKVHTCRITFDHHTQHMSDAEVNLIESHLCCLIGNGQFGDVTYNMLYLLFEQAIVCTVILISWLHSRIVKNS